MYFAGETGFTPQDTTLLLLGINTLDEIPADKGINQYKNLLTKILNSIVIDELEIIEDRIEEELSNRELDVCISDSFCKKSHAYSTVHILKKDIVKWLEDNSLSVPEVLSNPDNDLNNQLTAMPKSNKPLSDRERHSLLKVIGLLSMALADSKTGGQYGTKDKPNQKNIAERLSEYIPNEQDTGISVRTNRDRISEGLRLIDKLK